MLTHICFARPVVAGRGNGLKPESRRPCHHKHRGERRVTAREQQLVVALAAQPGLLHHHGRFLGGGDASEVCQEKEAGNGR